MLNSFLRGGALGPARSLFDDDVLCFVVDDSRRALAVISRGSSFV